MRLRRPVLAATLMVFASPCFAESSTPIPVNNPPLQQQNFIDLLALMSGHCKTLKVAGRTFACKTVAYAHGDKGRVNFAVAVDDPSDENHVVSFSGENGKRADDNSYELPIDRMLLNSKGPPEGRRPAGTGRADLHRDLPPDRQFRRQAGLRRHLLGDRQRGPQIRAAVRLGRQAGERAPHPPIRAVDPGIRSSRRSVAAQYSGWSFLRRGGLAEGVTHHVYLRGDERGGLRFANPPYELLRFVSKRGKIGVACASRHLAYSARHIGKPLSMTSPLPALIVVDVQRAFDQWEAAGKRRNNPDAVARIVDLLTAFRASGAPVFRIRHEGTKPTSSFLPTSSGYAVKDEAREQRGSP